ncbi:MAG: XdhC family protein [Candidatus Latescibacterota bacterium]
MLEVLQAAVRAGRCGQAGALVTPVDRGGSLPTGRDARLLVLADGTSVGTVGGGRLEAEAQAAARRVLETRRPRLAHFALNAADALAEGLLCGGEVTFFVEPLGGDPSPLAEMVRLAESGVPGLEALCLVEGEPVQRLVVEPGREAVGSLGASELDRSILAQAADLVEEDACGVQEAEAGARQVPVFVRALRPRPTVVICGGGHVGLALARLVPTAGMRLVVVDDRPEFCSRERFPMADQVHVRPFPRALEGLDVGPLTYVVAMTRGHQWDREVVAQALRTPAGYIGMIGSRRKIGLTWEALRQQGFGDGDLARVHAPIGLDLGGDTPGEIAISVMAELIQVRRQGGRRRAGDSSQTMQGGAR